MSLSVFLCSLAAFATVLGHAAPRDTVFDFLVGDWRVEASPRVPKLAAFVHGVPRFSGRWHATRTARGVADELRVNEADGSARLILRFERDVEGAPSTWRVREFDRDGKATAIMTLAVSAGTITLTATDRASRSRFVEVTPTRFRYLREVSSDGGRTWEEPVLVVTATRAAASRGPADPR